ncbi:zinc finger BED domain-containing protein [Pimephales promelas]|nr:zinc finger BED domain-containing protein [Pimephales promelas]
MSLYCIVEFIDEIHDGKAVVDIIPTCWMTEEDSECFWPSGRNVTKAVKGRQKPEESWPKYSIRVHGWAAITTDMWTDEFNKRAYTAFTGHFINDDWKLESRVISTAEFDSTLKKTAHNIHDQIIKELHDFGIEPAHMSKVMFVSDQGANIKAALRSYKWIPCINIVLKHTFDVKETMPTYMRDVSDVITKCKSLVTYLKKSGTVVQLPHTVTQECETWWNSKVAMVQSVSKQYREIQEALQEKDQLHRMDGIQLDVLNTVTEFLLPFKTASEEMEGDAYPTIQLVVLWFFKLKKHCEPQFGDPEYMAYIRAQATQLLNEKMSISVTHKLGTFFCPFFVLKSLKMFQAEERNAVYDHARRLVREFDSAPLTPALTKSRVKRKRDEFSEWEDDSEEVAERDEVQRYIEGQFFWDGEDILSFWESQSIAFPVLAKVSKMILCIPATSASSERTFSCAGQVLESGRNRLNSGTVDAILFLHSERKNVK